MTRDERYMELAIEQAKRAAAAGEIPVGAVIVCGDEVVAAAFNETEQKNDATRHAELIAIERASAALGDWRLDSCELFATLEPCAMCAGAIVNSRLRRIVFGAFDDRAGCCGSVCDLTMMRMSRADIEVLGGVLASPCAALLADFFAARRGAKAVDTKNRT